jgi:hypothetical protein
MAPFDANNLAVARPMPDAAPVIEIYRVESLIYSKRGKGSFLILKIQLLVDVQTYNLPFQRHTSFVVFKITLILY